MLIGSIKLTINNISLFITPEDINKRKMPIIELFVYKFKL